MSVGQNCVDRDFCSALQNSGKKCDAELKELCPVYCGLCEGMREIKFVDILNYSFKFISYHYTIFILYIDDDEVPLPRQGGQRRHGEDRHTKGRKRQIFFEI